MTTSEQDQKVAAIQGWDAVIGWLWRKFAEVAAIAVVLGAFGVYEVNSPGYSPRLVALVFYVMAMAWVGVGGVGIALFVAHDRRHDLIEYTTLYSASSRAPWRVGPNADKR